MHLVLNPLLVRAATAQTDAARAANAPSYSGEPSVIEHVETVIQIGMDGTGWKEYTAAVKVQSDAALRKYGLLSVRYASDSEHVELQYARVRHPDGAVVDTQTVDAIETPDPVTRTAPLYSDLRQWQLPIRSLRVGDTVEYKYRTVRTKAEAPGQFWGQESFANSAVVLSGSLELRVARDIHVNVWSPSLRPSESTEAATPSSHPQHIYRWTFRQLKPTVGVEAEAEAAAKKKERWTAVQELDAEQGKLPSVAWSTFNSWEEVGAWYRGLEAERIIPDESVKSKVAELIAGKSRDEDRALALYTYVATNIRYVGVDFGVGRYQPHAAPEILSNQYGDCKDKHTLLAAMLSVAGISADAVLIGAGVRFNEAVPSPASFNHLITHLTLGGQPVWLDATAEVAPYGLLLAPVRDKQALIVSPGTAPLGTSVAYIDRTPAKPNLPNSFTMDAVGSLDTDGVSTSKLVLTVRGDAEVSMRSAFRQLPPDKYDEAVQLFSIAIGFAGTTSRPEITRTTDTTQPFKLAFDYKREKAGDWEHMRTVAQVAPFALPRVTEMEPPVRAIQLGVPRTETSHSAMKLPAGWGAILPASVHANCAYGLYDMTFRFENGTVYAERRLQILAKKVPVSDWKTYKQWVDTAHPGQEPYIQLTRDSAASRFLNPAAATAGPRSSSGNQNWLEIQQTSATSWVYAPIPIQRGAAPGNAQADSLIRSAYSLFERKDLLGAQKTLDEAKALNPEQIGLWSTYGILANRRDSPEEANAAFQKELKLHPGQTNLYVLMESLEKRLNQREERRQTLKNWCAATSANPYPIIQLMKLEIEDGDPATALKELSSAPLAQEKRNDPKVQIVLGTAQVEAGDTVSGTATLIAMLKQTEDPFDLNNGAYHLAKAGAELALAEASVRRALGQLGSQSNTWTLQSNLDTPRNVSRSIISDWDTLGYVLFREGKWDEAKVYANAAWLNTLSDEVGENLGDILAAQGDKRGALAVYELAGAAVSSSDDSNSTQVSRELRNSIEDRVSTLRTSGISSGIADIGAELHSIRTVQLGPHDGGDAAAEYHLIIKDGNVEALAPISADKEVAGALGMVSKANLTRYFPQNSHVQLLRTGQITCYAGSCELLLR